MGKGDSMKSGPTYPIIPNPQGKTPTKKWQGCLSGMKVLLSTVRKKSPDTDDTEISLSLSLSHTHIDPLKGLIWIFRRASPSLLYGSPPPPPGPNPYPLAPSISLRYDTNIDTLQAWRLYCMKSTLKAFGMQLGIFNSVGIFDSVGI